MIRKKLLTGIMAFTLAFSSAACLSENSIGKVGAREVYEDGTFVYPKNPKGDVWPDAVLYSVAFPGRDRFHSKVYYKYMHFKNYNNYTEYLRGDVNKDGVVNITDVIKVAYYAKTACGNFAPDEQLLADANYDGEINDKDTTLIATIVKGKF